jgi:N utilization substance protein B
MALQTLYQMDISGMAPEEGLRLYYDHFDAPLPARPFTEQLVLGVYDHQSELDQFITSAAENWRVERMAPVDRNILRMALYEMLFCADIPPKVSINEAIDLGKKFGSEDSGSFINGILDHLLLKLHQEGQISDDEPSS